MLRHIAQDPDIDLTAYFLSDFSIKGYYDKGFGMKVEWDIPLTDGYKHKFLEPRYSDSVLTFSKPYFKDLGGLVDKSQTDILWIHGYHRAVYLRAMYLARKNGIKVVIRSDRWRKTDSPEGVKGKIKDFLRGKALALAHGYLALGTKNREYYESLGADPKTVFMVPYAVDNEWFMKTADESAKTRDEFRKELGLEPDRPIILFASKFQPRKRADDLYDAYLKLIAGGADPVPYLLYIGEGECKAALEARVAADGQKNVRFLGFQNQSVLPRYMDLCDVFVLPSGAEPWGVVINEVMCASKPVIVTDEVGCAVDIVREGETGWIYPLGDSDALAKCLKDTLYPIEKARQMGLAARKLISTWDFDSDVAGLKDAIRYFGLNR